MAGDENSLHAFRLLASRLLALTVAHPSAGLRLHFLERRRDRAVLASVAGPTAPLRLLDGRYLRVAVSLRLFDTDEGRRLKVVESSCQYQADEVGKAWIVRYDYLRSASGAHPPGHLQLNGRLTAVPGVEVGRLHFPTGRVPLEAVIRLLVEEFGVPTNEEAELWRPVLAESEAAFQAIAHRPLSGPAH
ncbi:MAG TPA: hypothetical protein VGW75_03715 [Solirubrobacteraceae bacterium]|jgi:hypothetical protein|nr:hypothetical protein [Solirubrobacteraceae bacterium]